MVFLNSTTFLDQGYPATYRDFDGTCNMGIILLFCPNVHPAATDDSHGCKQKLNLQHVNHGATPAPQQIGLQKGSNIYVHLSLMSY